MMIHNLQMWSQAADQRVQGGHYCNKAYRS